MSTRIRNVLSTTIATLAASVTACVLISSDASAMGLGSFGSHAMAPHAGGLGGKGLAGLGHGTPMMNRSMTGGAVRPTNMMNPGRPTNSTMTRAGRGEGATRSTVQPNSRVKETGQASASHQERPLAKEDQGKSKPSHAPENRVSENRASRYAGPEKSPMSTERRGERINDAGEDRDYAYRSRDGWLPLVPDIVPVLDAPNVETFGQNNQYVRRDRIVVRGKWNVIANENPPAGTGAPNTPQTFNVDNGQSSTTERVVTENGTVVQREWFDPTTGHTVEKRRYNANGIVVEQEFFDQREGYRTQDRKFDPTTGRLKTTEYYDKDGNRTVKVTYEKNTGNPEQIDTFDPSTGRMIKTVIIDPRNGQVVETGTPDPNNPNGRWIWVQASTSVQP